MSAGGPAEPFLARLDDVSSRLAAHAARQIPRGLTAPDPPTGERWDWGQVWAHLAEFPPYWMGQVKLLLAAAGADPIPFGRVKSDAGRIASIERDRSQSLDVLWERVAAHVGTLRDLLRQMPAEAWTKRGRHSTLGVMDMRRIVDEFLVGHLEEHADQLDGLARSGGGGA